MVENAFAETLREGEPVRRRKIYPRLPFLGAAILKRLRRNPELHGVSSLFEPVVLFTVSV
jgi:hypothetical protein